MKGMAELVLSVAVLAACWTRTPIGTLGQAAVGWAQGTDDRVDLLASFRTELPPRLETALADAFLAEPPTSDPGEPRAVGEAWTPAIRVAIQSHLGDEALAEIQALGLATPEAAIETWAVGAELRSRAVGRARAAGADQPEALAAHISYLPESAAREATRAVSDTLSLATVLDLAWPVDPDLRVSSGFGYRHHPTLKRKKLHEGVDIPLPIGTPVHAVGAGEVRRARQDGVNGKHVILNHGHRVTSAYCHGDDLRVKKGDRVARGAHILDSGNTGRSTGPHLHFGVRIAGRAIDPAPFRGRAAAEDAPVQAVVEAPIPAATTPAAREAATPEPASPEPATPALRPAEETAAGRQALLDQLAAQEAKPEAVADAVPPPRP